MQAVILCTGPSLARLRDVPACKVSIALKRAALRFECDWWACIDSPCAIENFGNIRGNPGLLTSRATNLKMGHAFPETVCVEDLGLLPETYTAIASLCLAHYLGATQIDVYGADWTDAPDFDGHCDNDARRDLNRWERERRLWDEECFRLAYAGVKVTKH